LHCTGNTFYEDSISIPGSKWGTQEPLTLKAPQFNWIATQVYVSSGSSACRGPVLADLLVPCNNVPTVFEAFVAAGALSKRHNMFSIYINKDTSTNGEVQATSAVITSSWSYSQSLWHDHLNLHSEPHPLAAICLDTV
jgi:hypothetical protein